MLSLQYTPLPFDLNSESMARIVIERAEVKTDSETETETKTRHHCILGGKVGTKIAGDRTGEDRTGSVTQ